MVTGPLTVGNAADYGGFDHQGSLSVGSHNITLNTKGFAILGSLTTIDNGTLQAGNGISLGIGRVLTGSGTVEAKLAAGFGFTIEATGDLDLGSASNIDGFFSDGQLIVGSHTVTIHDEDIAVLGSVTNLGSETDEGTLVAANGLLIEQGKSLTGYGLVTGDLVNQGNVYGDSPDVDERLVFDTGHTVSGIDSFTNVQFNGTYSPGQSPGITELIDTVFGSSATVKIELGGLNAGSEYDRIVTEGSSLSLDGHLIVDLINGFTLSVIPELAILKGDVDDVGSVNNLDITPFIGLLTEAGSNATAVPEPGLFACVVLALMMGPRRAVRR